MNRYLPYLQLVRLPNVFTAFADIAMAGLVAGALPRNWLPFTLLLLASGCLYCGGMVWNDYFDLRIDERERPSRPLPSGRVSLRTAFLLGVTLLVAGLAFAGLADAAKEEFCACSLTVAVLLAGAILLYDAWLKRTVAGPLGMGLCRFLNVLLGLTAVSPWVGGWGFLPALVVGLYVAGVTWFARKETETSDPTRLAGGALLMLAAVVLALTLPVAGGPVRLDAETNLPASGQVWLGQMLYPYLLVAFTLWVGTPIVAALRRPGPTQVQRAVKRCLFGLVPLDATLATAFVGPAALLLLLLLVPAWSLGRRVYST